MVSLKLLASQTHRDYTDFKAQSWGGVASRPQKRPPRKLTVATDGADSSRLLAQSVVLLFQKSLPPGANGSPLLAQSVVVSWHKRFPSAGAKQCFPFSAFHEKTFLISTGIFRGGVPHELRVLTSW